MRRLLLALLAMALVLPLAPSATAEDFHIVRGEPAAPGAYPWMAAFLFDGGQGCGGSLIRPNWILTASHCVADDRGQPSVTPEQATFVVNANNWTDGSGQTLRAAEIIIHPNYDAATTDNDVALIRTTEDATGVTPVQIATATEQTPAPGVDVRVIGYGTTSSGGEASDILLQVDVPIVSDAECAAGYGNLNAPNMLCAGAPTQDEANPGRDSCQGDSGGPLCIDGAQPVQIGVVSFGIGCGAPLPGVYAEVSTYAEWIQGIVGGDLNAGDPDPGPVGEQPTGAADMVVRIQGQTDPNGAVDNAIAISQYVFQTPGEFGVLAASANFPDALGGSALASYYGPLLYVNPDGTLSEDTVREFQRALDPGSTIYVLGGTAVIGPDVAAALEAAGFVVERLAGAGRQQTARIVADKVNEVVNQGAPPFDSVIVAFEGNWPDAVTVGSISGWFGIPVLLTPTAELGGPAAEYLQENMPAQVMVLGGDAVISQNVRDQIQAIIGEDGFVQPLFGDSRFETAADIAFYTQELFTSNDEIFEFEGEAITEPDVLVAVNLEQPDAFTHVLAASSLVGNFGGLFVAVDSAGGFRDAIVPAICGIDKQVFAIGSTALVTDEATQQIQAASAGTSCDPNDPFGLGG